MTLWTITVTFAILLMVVAGVALTMCMLGHDKDRDGLP